MFSDPIMEEAVEKLDRACHDYWSRNLDTTSCGSITAIIVPHFLNDSVHISVNGQPVHLNPDPERILKEALRKRGE